MQEAQLWYTLEKRGEEKFNETGVYFVVTMVRDKLKINMKLNIKIPFMYWHLMGSNPFAHTNHFHFLKKVFSLTLMVIYDDKT